MVLAAAAISWVLPAPVLGDPSPASIDPGAPSGAELTAHTVRKFESYDLPVAAFGREVPATRQVEGRTIWSAYRLADPEASTAAVIEAYRARLSGQGFEEVFSCRTEACGGFDYRFSVKLLPAPGMLLDTADFSQLTMLRPADGGAATGAQVDEAASAGAVYVSIVASRLLGAVYVQTVVVEPAGTPIALVDSAAEETAAETVILPQDEKALYDRLMSEGHVPLTGLVFATGGTEISPESKNALDMIGRLLARNADVTVAIVGHSDNQGPLETNIKLSQARAEAVRQALIARTVHEDQMIAKGVGWLAPVASNATEEGRARNRRVELVLVQTP